MAMLNNQRVYFLGKGNMLGPTLARWLENHTVWWTNTRRSHSVGQVDAEDSEHVEAIASGSSIGDDPREVFRSNSGCCCSSGWWPKWNQVENRSLRNLAQDLKGLRKQSCMALVSRQVFKSLANGMREYHETLTTSVNFDEGNICKHHLESGSFFFHLRTPPKSEG